MTRKESLKAYALANKEAISANKKRYYEANKEKIKAYREANKEKIKAYRKEYSKEYYESNKDSLKSRQAKYRKSLTNDYYTLYYLKEEHYVGITSQPDTRMRRHKHNGKHVLDYEVISTFKTKREALDAEKYMHSIGYCG